ncbi:MAG: hypothetical protein ACM3U2_01005 [Deltaproteobacteria bacterium]
MPSTFGGFWVHEDHAATHVVLNLPRGVDAVKIRRVQYSGPRVIMPEKIQDFEKWLGDRKREGFVLTTIE